MFENAKFGDWYKTRDGRKAIFMGINNNEVIMLYNFSLTDYPYIATECVHLHNGKKYADIEHGNDIVGKWETPINEGELDKIANKSSKELYNGFVQTEGIWICGFKVGYRKAMENYGKIQD